MTTATDTPRTTLDGWIPQIGSLVWEQMYDPQHPAHDSSIEERVAAGHTYGPRFLTRVVGIVDHGNGLLSFHTRDDGSGPGWFPRKGHGPSLTDSDWCVLEDAHDEEGALF